LLRRRKANDRTGVKGIRELLEQFERTGSSLPFAIGGLANSLLSFCEIFPSPNIPGNNDAATERMPKVFIPIVLRFNLTIGH
jgi:hypothetical protein